MAATPATAHPRLTVRLTPDARHKVQALAESRGVSAAHAVRQLIAEADVDATPRPPRHLSEEELIDVLHERAAAGNVSAVKELLAIERERDPRESALEALERMAEERRQ